MDVQGVSPPPSTLYVQGVFLSTTSSMAVQGVSLSTASSMAVQGVSLSTASSMDVQGVSLPPPHPQEYGRARCITFQHQQFDISGCIHFHCQRYGRAGCIPFYPPPQKKRVGTCKMYHFSIPAVWPCRVHPFLPPAVWEVQLVSLSTTSSGNVQGVSHARRSLSLYSFSPVYVFFKYWTVWHPVSRYLNAQICRCQNANVLVPDWDAEMPMPSYDHDTYGRVTREYSRGDRCTYLLTIYAPMIYTALCIMFWKTRVFWTLWNGIEPIGECHLGPRKLRKVTLRGYINSVQWMYAITPTPYNECTQFVDSVKSLSCS